MKSQRADGHGHWPAGKARSPLTAAEVAAVTAKLNNALALHSIRGLARLLDMSDRTVRRILKGRDTPSAATAAKINQRLHA